MGRTWMADSSSMATKWAEITLTLRLTAWASIFKAWKIVFLVNFLWTKFSRVLRETKVDSELKNIWFFWGREKIKKCLKISLLEKDIYFPRVTQSKELLRSDIFRVYMNSLCLVAFIDQLYLQAPSKWEK